MFNTSLPNGNNNTVSVSRIRQQEYLLEVTFDSFDNVFPLVELQKETTYINHHKFFQHSVGSQTS